MDNDESFFSSPKSFLGLIVFGGISLYFIYWIYINIIKDDQNNQNDNRNNHNHNIYRNNNNNINKSGNKSRKFKQKLSINMSILMKDTKKSILMDINYLYDLFDKLSDFYNLYLLVHIEDNINAEKIKENILTYLEPIISDNILYDHRIIFCTSIEGMSAIIRSLDPFIHIENNNYLVVQLIRYINEFWFVKQNNEKKEIVKKIEADTNNAKQNIKELVDKIKFFPSFNDLINKEIKNN
jgi:hypothetical protein